MKRPAGEAGRLGEEGFRREMMLSNDNNDDHCGRDHV
jgi:hypothetical protein